MNYYKVKIFQGEDDKKEIIVNEEIRNRIEIAMDSHATRINLGEKGSYNSSQIMGIELCNAEVAEYQRQGIKIEGLLEPADKPKEITGGVRKFGDIFKEKKDEFYQRMGWK